MMNEVENFLKRGSWEFVDRAAAAEMGKNIISSKWVYKKKIELDGSTCYQSWIVFPGFIQVPGVDHTEHLSPVANNTATRLIFVLTLFFVNWICETANIKAALLKG